MRIFIAGLDTETNTFSPMPTVLESFEACLLAHGDATRRLLNHCSAQLAVWRRLAEERGWTVIESLCAVAEPAGVTSGAVYETFRDEIVRGLQAAVPVDLVLLAMHGAMVAEGYDDVEGDLLLHVRTVIGSNVPIGVELDLHCNLTDQMLGQATAIVLYKEYPHTDIEERAADLFQLTIDAAERRTRPVMAMFDCRMIGSFRTQEEPLRSFVARMKSLEGRGAILSVSFAHGFPWSDVDSVGAKMLVLADGDFPKAQELAITLGREVYEMREALKPTFLSIDEALSRTLACASGPVVLADVADNPGGGAAGDATFIIQQIRARGIRSVASALHWDPMAVRFCQQAGEGAILDLRIGGKTGPASGTPVDLRAKVRRIASGITQRFGQLPLPIGDAVWIEADGLHLVLNNVRTQLFHPECLIALGLDLESLAAVVVKSTNHFYAGFAPLAREILFVDSPGTLQMRFDRIPYTKAPRPYWPKVHDPLADTAWEP